MTTTYSGNAANFPAAVTLPADAVDFITAMSFAQGLEDLADRTAYLAQSIGNPLTNWMGPITLPAGVGQNAAGAAYGGPQALIAYTPLVGTSKLPRYVAIGGTDLIAKSDDLRTWTTIGPTGGTGVKMSCIATDGAGKFVAGGVGKNFLYTSADGTAFAATAALTSWAGTEGAASIVWNSTLSLWVALSDSGHLSTSPDMTTWTTQTTAIAPGAGTASGQIVVGPSGLMLVVYGAGANALAQKSTNGTTWSTVTMPETSNWFGLTYNTALSLWVASDFNGKVYTSPDATNWTLKYTSPTGGSAARLRLAAIGPFIAAADVTSELRGRIIFSTDKGVTWRREAIFGNGTATGGSVHSVQRIGNRIAVTGPSGLYISGACGASDLADL